MNSSSGGRGARRFPLLRNYPVNVQRTAGPPDSRLVGQVVGTVNGENVIVCGLAAGSLTPGEDVIVRMAVGNEVVEFATRVLESTTGGVSLFMLAVPEHVKPLNLRKAERLNLFVPAEVQFSRGNSESPSGAYVAFVQGTMVNLSHSGCCLSTKRPLALEQPIRLSFSLPGSRRTYRLGARVLHQQGSVRPGVFVHGVQFGDPVDHSTALAELNQWIGQNLPFALPN